MRNSFPQALAALVVVAIICGARPGFAGDRTLKLEIAPVFQKAPLRFDSLTNITVAGQTLSVTRLDFLLSNFGLRRQDGTWIEQTNWFAYFSAREGKKNSRLENIPAGSYDRVRFLVGLKPEINHSQAANYPASHPLNPDVNGLHWGWMGGYVFLALEGNWLQPDGRQSGFSYHLANDRQLMTIELPALLNMTGDRELRLTLDVDQIFGGTNPFVISASTGSTHSRTNDLVANTLHANIERAFAVAGVSGIPLANSSDGRNTRLEMAADATPYRLTISAFFPRPALPADNPLTGEGVALGRKLFFDPQLSINNSQSCASCHNPSGAFTDNQRVSTGAEGKT
ncbi:MAG TPA: MbnP family protein, partial [Verrucomicrobiae bacterium]|nr:MbnP family protein [Verrucomicrobiae bacterium]